MEAEEANSSEKEEGLPQVEVTADLFFNGYSFTFKELSLHCCIMAIPKPPKIMKISWLVLFDGAENGKIDITKLVNGYQKMQKEYPDCDIKILATGFARRFKFSKDLLSAPMPNFIHEMFGKKLDGFS